MIKTDARKFEEELLSMFEVITTGKYAPSKNVVKTWWGALAGYELNIVLSAFSRYVRTGTYPPKPSDILNIIGVNDGRPEAEEAWAMVARCEDEAETIVWTQEMASAWALASPLLDGKGNVSARMTFKQHYERLIQQARENAVPVKWSPSLGSDSSRRNDALKDAESKGLISHETVKNLCIENMTSEGNEIAGLLGYSKNVVAHPTAKEDHKQHMEKLKADLKAIDEKNKKEKQAARDKAYKEIKARRALLIAQEEELLARAKDNYSEATA